MTPFLSFDFLAGFPGGRVEDAAAGGRVSVSAPEAGAGTETLNGDGRLGGRRRRTGSGPGGPLPGRVTGGGARGGRCHR